MPTLASRATRLDLIERTRAARGVGKRAASLYGWHSLRATFVVLAVEAGVPLPDVQKIVGHSTAEMTLQYFNPTAKHTAERVRQQMRGGVLVAHVFAKKTQATPKAVIDVCKARFKAYDELTKGA